MKVLIIGGTGTVGKAVIEELNGRHEIIVASRTGGDIQVDIENEASIVEMYKKLPKLDAVVVTTGGRGGHVAPLTEMSVEDYRVGLDSKLLGQVNVVLKGIEFMNEGGSFTLIGGASGAQDVVPQLSNFFMVNAALEGFVTAAATELPKSLRINAVCPTVITESMPAFGSYFRGFSSVPSREIAMAFSKSIEGVQTGQNYNLS
ncbi:short chain dehydrogenase [Neobacillus massiliamazoniensis]|uniref:Short chain dehydrogenase n=2 Tax=Neobacillus massiliamazoniensis TaxID=1499688 RepID=A0A0U1NZB6_9BACI|nr:short chain dehydrogenase [Neobacillus massiliamazoniensis]